MKADPIDSARRERFAVLFELHYDELMRYARRRTDADTARDVVADSFLVAWRRLNDIPEHAARAWLYGTARHVLANSRRTHHRESALAKRAANADIAHPVDDPAEVVVESIRVRQVLGTLSVTDQEVLRLSEWEQLDLTEMSRVLRCSPGAAKVRLHRARRRFAAAMMESDAEDQPSRARQKIPKRVTA